MKSTVAFSQMLMLSTSLLCLSSFAAQPPTQSPTEESKEVNSGVTVGTPLASMTTEQTGAAKQQQGMPSGQKNTQKKNCMVADNPHRFVIKHIESKGVGYDQGYTSLDAFLTGNVCNFVPFIDLRGHVFNNGKWAGNAGIGTRYVVDPCKSMFGINAYYDYRKTKHFHYNQIGAGIEAYYDRFEFLANGYLPVGRKRMRTEHALQSIDFKRFSGNYILYSEDYKNKYEGAMKGFDAEVGGHFAGDMKNYDLYFGIGPYYYDLIKDKHTWGGRARLKLELSKWLFLEGIDTWDHIFHNRVQGSVTFNVPFGVKKCYGKKKLPNNQMQNCDNVMDWLAVLPVDRQEIIVVDKFKKKQTIDPVAIDPTTGNPFYVVFVNNSNPNVGDGTFENPFAFLSHSDAVQSTIMPTPPNAQDNSFANTTIYVFPGDGTNRRQSVGMVLPFEGQRMLGSAIAHTYVTTAGVLTIPPQSAVTPFITGTVGGANAVSINVNNCEVSGFNIAMQTQFPGGDQSLSALGNSCIATAFSAVVTNVTLTNNVCVNEINGIFLGAMTQGNVIVSNNILSMHPGKATGTTPTSGWGISGIGSTNANILISNNQITFNPQTGMGANNHAGGINLILNDQVQATVLNNIINSVSGDGIDVTWTSPTAAGLTGSCVIQNNMLNNVGLAGFMIGSGAPAAIPGSIKAIALNNTIISQTNSTQFFTLSSGPVPSPQLLVRFLDNTIAATSPSTVVNFGTGTSATARLLVEPTAGNTCSFTMSGTSIITPIVPCQYGGPGCP